MKLTLDFEGVSVIIVFSSLDNLWGDRLIAEYSEFDLIPANLCQQDLTITAIFVEVGD